MDRQSDSRQNLEARRKFTHAFNDTLVRIWNEKQYKLFPPRLRDLRRRARFRSHYRASLSSRSSVSRRTGNLYMNTLAQRTDAAGEYTSVRFELSFPYYGIYVDAGTGRETPIGNPGDIGRQKIRKPKPWFSPKHYMSVMNLRDFYADNLGLRVINVMANAIDDKAIRSSFSRPDSVAMRGPVSGLAIPATNMPL